MLVRMIRIMISDCILGTLDQVYQTRRYHLLQASSIEARMSEMRMVRD